VIAIFNIGKAAYPAGKTLLDSFEGVTKKWADWTGSMKGQNTLKAYFEHALPIMYELGALIHDVVLDFFDLGKNDALAGLVRQIRTDILPAVKTLADNLQGAFGQSLVTAIGDVINLLADLTGAGGDGYLTTFVDTLDTIVNDIDALIKMPGVGPVIGFLFSLAGGIAAVGLVLGPAIKGPNNHGRGSGRHRRRDWSCRRGLHRHGPRHGRRHGSRRLDHRGDHPPQYRVLRVVPAQRDVP
jgi:hypothetical protein